MVGSIFCVRLSKKFQIVSAYLPMHPTCRYLLIHTLSSSLTYLTIHNTIGENIIAGSRKEFTDIFDKPNLDCGTLLHYATQVHVCNLFLVPTQTDIYNFYLFLFLSLSLDWMRPFPISYIQISFFLDSKHRCYPYAFVVRCQSLRDQRRWSNAVSVESTGRC